MAALTLLSIHQAAQSLLDCACAALDAIPDEIPGLVGCPCRVGVVPGTVAADGCDGGCNVKPGEAPGQLTVSTRRVFASDSNSFPRELGLGADRTTGGVRDRSLCRLPQLTAVELLLTLFRCAPGPDESGCPPSMADLDGSAMQYHADMLAIQRAILCCYPATELDQRRNGRRFIVGATTTIGPDGGCVGFQTSVTVALDGQLPPLPGPVGAP
jgi:hypothetical protein